LPSYISKSWSALEADLLQYYDAERSESRFILRDLKQLLQKWKQRKIENRPAFKKYLRQYKKIAGFLVHKSKISDNDEAGYFWQGLPKTLRERIEIRILAEDPEISVLKPFPMKTVERIAFKILEPNRFEYILAESDIELPDTDSDLDDSSDDEGYMSDSEAEKSKKHKKQVRKLLVKKRPKKTVTMRVPDPDSDDDDKFPPRLRKSHKEKLTKKKRKPEPLSSDSESDSEDDEPTQHISRTRKDLKHTQVPKQDKVKSLKQDEIEDLISQLSDMAVDDPKYGLLYYKALKLDSTVEKCVEPPAPRAKAPYQNPIPRNPIPPPRPQYATQQPQYANQQPQYANQQPQYTGQLPPPSLPTRQTPPHMTGNPPLPRPPLTCYGCGKQGHSMRDCIELQKRIQQGDLKKDEYGKITFRDGTLVQRNMGESIIAAADRRNGMSTHLFTLRPAEFSDYYQSDADDEDDCIQVEVLAAERDPKIITRSRKEAMDKFTKPPNRKGKETQQDPPHTSSRQAEPSNSRPGVSTRSSPQENIPPPKASPVKTQPRRIVPEPIPVDARQPRIIEIEDISMGDATTQVPVPSAPPLQSPMDSLAASKRHSVKTSF